MLAAEEGRLEVCKALTGENVECGASQRRTTPRAYVNALVSCTQVLYSARLTAATKPSVASSSNLVRRLRRTDEPAPLSSWQLVAITAASWGTC